MERMETEKKPDEHSFGAKEAKRESNGEGSKVCPNCGLPMRWWAYKDPFDICPQCGENLN